MLFGFGVFMAMIHIYAFKGQIEQVEAELADVPMSINSRCDTNEETPILIASRAGHVALVKMLLEKNADLLIPNCDNNTPLHAVMYRALQLTKAGENAENFYEIIKMFLKKNIKLLEIPGDGSFTPFQITYRYPAIKHRLLEIIREIDPKHPYLTVEPPLPEINYMGDKGNKNNHMVSDNHLFQPSDLLDVLIKGCVGFFSHVNNFLSKESNLQIAPPEVSASSTDESHPHSL